MIKSTLETIVAFSFLTHHYSNIKQAMHHWTLAFFFLLKKAREEDETFSMYFSPVSIFYFFLTIENV